MGWIGAALFLGGNCMACIFSAWVPCVVFALGGIAPVRGVPTAASALCGGRLAGAWGWWAAVYHCIEFMRFP